MHTTAANTAAEKEERFKKALLDLCRSHGFLIAATANPTNNILCDPKVIFYEIGKDETTNFEEFFE